MINKFGRYGGRASDSELKARMAMDVSSGYAEAVRWSKSKRYEDDVREHDVEDIKLKFGLTDQEAQQLFREIQSRYGR